VVVVLVALVVGCGKEGASGDGADAAGVTIIRAPEVVATTPAEGPLRDKLLELAVAGECLRRAEVDPEAALAAMDALYRGHGIALDVYAKEMSVLSADSRFGAAVEERLTRCAGVVAALVPGGVAVEADAASAPDAVVDTVAQAADVAPGQDTSVVSVDVRDPVADGVAAIVDAFEPGPVDVVAPPPDVVTEAPDVVAEVKVEPKPEPRYSGTWNGTVSGTSSGTLRVTVQGSRVTGAVATFGRSTLRLKGSISDKGVLSLGGTAGDEFIRLSGKLDRSGQAIGGTWDGVIDRKRSNGKFRIAR
jgi:hypothetical protein